MQCIRVGDVDDESAPELDLPAMDEHVDERAIELQGGELRFCASIGDR